MSFASSFETILGRPIAHTPSSPDDSRKEKLIQAALAAQFKQRQERDRAKKAGGREWAQYLQKQSQRRRRANQSRLQGDKRLKRFNRAQARRDVPHYCVQCRAVLKEWRPNRKYYDAKCGYERRRAFKRWWEITGIELLCNARNNGDHEHEARTIKALGGQKKVERLASKYPEYF
jgi:hypothetical protein